MAPKLSKKEALALVARLKETIPASASSLKQEHVQVASQIFAQVLDSLDDSLNVLWVSKIHVALSGWLDAAVERKLAKLDPNDNVLYDVSDILTCIVQDHPNDARKAISDVTLGPLATLALEQERHDGEAVEASMKLLAALFHGSDESRKLVRSDFFCKIQNPRCEDEAALERSDVCLELLKVICGVGWSGTRTRTCPAALPLLASCGLRAVRPAFCAGPARFSDVGQDVQDAALPHGHLRISRLSCV